MRHLHLGTAQYDYSQSQFERVLNNAARLAMVGIGFAVLLAMLQAGQVFLAPVTLAIVVGLMFGPVADRLEGKGGDEPEGERDEERAKHAPRGKARPRHVDEGQVTGHHLGQIGED